MTNTIDWLLTSDEPWTRYRTLVDLLGRQEEPLALAHLRSAADSAPYGT